MVLNLYDFATTTSADLQRGYGGMLVGLPTFWLGEADFGGPEAVDPEPSRGRPPLDTIPGITDSDEAEGCNRSSRVIEGESFVCGFLYRGRWHLPAKPMLQHSHSKEAIGYGAGERGRRMSTLPTGWQASLLGSYIRIHIYVDTHCVLFDNADISALAEAEDCGWAEALPQ